MSYFDVTAWNLNLSGTDNQNIRLLIRRYRRSLVAIPGYGVPILQCLMPLAARHATSLEALLTLATQFRVSQKLLECTREINRRSPDLALDSHQRAVSTLRSSLSRLQCGNGDIEEAIAVSMILWVFGCPGHDIWSIHLNGLIALLEATPLPGLDTLLPLSLHRLATVAAAHLDIKAISVGRTEPSQRLWLHWRLCPPEEILSFPMEEKPFSAWEISFGYPETLMTIIALVSAVVEDDISGRQVDPICMEYLERLADQKFPSAESNVNLIAFPSLIPNARNEKLALLMETVIINWRPPSITDTMSLEASIALTAMWEVMRKATIIYLWRGGFETDVTTTLSRERQLCIHRCVHEMCSNIDQVIQTAEKFHLPMAKSLMWPLAVIANEASGSPDLQRKIMDYIRRIDAYFMIPHHELMETVLRQLWEEAKGGNPDAASGVSIFYSDFVIYK
ncbi:hypothetical protein N7478_009884 [Penicillium angulare]|uniref:uncharacterized protein n=1 Tax=Penicillium angulare TaxID=116970 RepID=UPI00254043E7|nr:uncharacterized protein N7478_009884 [Penicillium angulare]KAJ5267076.1 hypothetical protein N7478_009884 [Penicillium angulare]